MLSTRFRLCLGHFSQSAFAPSLLEAPGALVFLDTQRNRWAGYNCVSYHISCTQRNPNKKVSFCWLLTTPTMRCRASFSLRCWAPPTKSSILPVPLPMSDINASTCILNDRAYWKLMDLSFEPFVKPEELFLVPVNLQRRFTAHGSLQFPSVNCQSSWRI